MKSISEMTLGQAMIYVRKKSKEYSSRDKVSQATGIDKWELGHYENDKDLPTKKEWELISSLMGNKELTQKGYEIIEYKRTHPEVKLCLADNTTCWKCGREMHTAYGMINGFPIAPDGFNEEMLGICKEKGVVLQDRRSNTTGETHRVNVCPHCGAFIGEFYMHDLWYGETETIVISNVEDFIEEWEE